MGVVSSVAAQVVEDEMAQGDLIATDAVMAPAAEGGALLDARGRVVGVLTAAGERGTMAVPITRATDVAGQLRRTGKVGHGWAGIGGTDAPGGGVLVRRVEAGSPAATAGIEPGDVVVAVGGERVGGMGDLVTIVRRHRPGDELDVRLRRGSGSRRMDLRLGEVPSEATVTTTTVATAASLAG
jgi:S1-C subfamily serine protease